MASIRPCCCVTNRKATLIFLYLYVIGCAWTLLTFFTDLGDALSKEFWQKYPSIFYSSIFIQVVGGVIFLAAIISISSGKPRISLLYMVIAFLILNVIYSIFSTFLYTSNGVLDELWNISIEEQVRKQPSNRQDEVRRALKQQYPLFVKSVYGLLAINLSFIFYSIFVFYSYLTELKENPANGAVVGRRVEV